jgi:oxygen-independent coproporphyrinogen III oxidase
LAGIYVHIPFCRQACIYCDFYFSTSLSAREPVIRAIAKECETRSDYLPERNVTSVYFGGGTPSLLASSDLVTIIDALRASFSWDETAEVTLEANPEDINTEALRLWRSMGFNRLSIGLQSFNEAELKWMNRKHTPAQSADSVKRAQDEGFGNISIDLIYGSKFQDLKSWESTLASAIALNTQHISSYNLTIEQKTVLGAHQRKGKEPAISDEMSGRQFMMMIEALEDYGFIHYEISNFAKEGFYARHNSNYWLQQPYLGLGPSAHSFDGTSRQWNVANNSLYLKGVNENGFYFEKEDLSPRDKYNEYVLTRLRTIWGCRLGEMKVWFGEQATEHFKAIADTKKDLIAEQDGVYTLTRQGRLYADGIASDLFLL